jgi:hypothetical protein
MQINQQTIGYTDLGLSAFLAMHFNLLELRKVSENRVEFIFGKTPDLLGYTEDYFNNRASVSPSTYFDSIKNLKSRIYSRK